MDILNKCIEHESSVMSDSTEIQLSKWTTMLKTSSNVVKRIVLGVFLVAGFSAIIFMGPLMILFFFVVLQVCIFHEILAIGYSYNQFPNNLPYFRTLNWYFLIIANFFFIVEAITPHFHQVHQQEHFLHTFVQYHKFISFCLYLIGMVWFVFSLVKKHDLKQFKILAWIHILILIIVVQAHMVTHNIFYGIIWVLLPIFLVIMNDIFAYIFGQAFGKTPLIKLSPKKTWEGFIGGMFATLVFGLILSNFMCQYKYFVCPIEYTRSETGLLGLELKTDCTPSYLFTRINYKLDSIITIEYYYYPFTLHFISIALFASIVAPFGGFCASGFKRAVKIKDFGDVIPGHGGLTDRFDCQFLIATFVNVYIFTFVKQFSVNLMFDKILSMDHDQQREFYFMFKKTLTNNGLLQ